MGSSAAVIHRPLCDERRTWENDWWRSDGARQAQSLPMTPTLVALVNISALAQPKFTKSRRTVCWRFGLRAKIPRPNQRNEQKHADDQHRDRRPALFFAVARRCDQVHQHFQYSLRSQDMLRTSPQSHATPAEKKGAGLWPSCNNRRDVGTIPFAQHPVIFPRSTNSGAPCGGARPGRESAYCYAHVIACAAGVVRNAYSRG
jgi:hypothetical protein